MRTIQDYFRRKPKQVPQSSVRNITSPSRKYRTRARPIQQYIQTMLKLTKRHTPSFAPPHSPVSTSRILVQNKAPVATSLQDIPQEIKPTNDTEQKGSTLANLVKKFERWKTGTPRSIQKKPDKSPTLEYYLRHNETATR